MKNFVFDKKSENQDGNDENGDDDDGDGLRK